MKLVVSKFARKDQDEISRYTYDRWGRDQLHRYIGALLDVFDEIAVQPAIGRQVRGLPPRFRRVAYGSHFIFYTVTGDQIKIERILHQRMDVASRLV